MVSPRLFFHHLSSLAHLILATPMVTNEEAEK
jgi:hypothetical protein